ncbi:Uma2 family endonuclease [Candidatus Aerophobetes bacterium]|nr:Uma2 family endonuclease [Candidatus Aerophobetes bacterium]
MKETVDLDQEIWTYEDYVKIPEDRVTHQIIGGKLFMTPAPSSYHQKVSRNLEFAIWSYVKENNLGEVFDAPIDVVFSSVNVVQPDIVFISKDRLKILEERGIFGAPDLVVEIISPGTSELDVKLKKQLYQRFGVREYWIVYPEEKKVEVFKLKGGSFKGEGTFLKEDTLAPELFPGLKINLNEIFS